MVEEVKGWVSERVRKAITVRAERLSSKVKNCMIAEIFINTIESNGNESDANSIGENSADTKVELG